MNPITMQLVADKYIKMALEEDINSEDVSTNAVMPEYKKGDVQLICKEDELFSVCANISWDIFSFPPIS